MIRQSQQNNNISVKKYNRISKYEDREKILKMWHFKTAIVRVILGGLVVIKQDKHINKKAGNPSQYEIEKIALCRTTGSKKHYYIEYK